MSAKTGGVDRRALLRGAAFATAAGGLAAHAAHARAAKTAVVFLSRSGNTRMLAGDLSRRRGADLIEILPRDPWPADYEEMVAWASGWRDSARPPPLAGRIDLTGYGTVFLGFPIWGGALPAPMRSALIGQDLSGKTLLPFITHGGYGPGGAMDEVSRLAPRAAVADPFVLRCDQERDNLDALRGWLANAAP